MPGNHTRDSDSLGIDQMPTTVDLESLRAGHVLQFVRREITNQHVFGLADLAERVCYILSDR